MQAEHSIYEELRELDSRLSRLQKLQPYTVPEPGYFTALPGILTGVAESADTPDPRPDWGTGNPFSVPHGYLESLPGLLSGTQPPAESQSATFSVPEGYFGQLPQQLLAGIKAEQPCSGRKSVVFRPLLRRAVPWMAAAALMAGVWFGLRTGGPAGTADARAVAALSVVDPDSLGRYVEQHADEFDPETLEAALAGGGATDFSEAVSALPDDEIEEYLNDAVPEARASDGT